jgi:hypothetical protein
MIRLVEIESFDSYKQQKADYDAKMTLYRQQKADYDDALEKYWSEYNQWDSKTPMAVFNEIRDRVREVFKENTNEYQYRAGFNHRQNGIRSLNYDWDKLKYNKPNKVELEASLRAVFSNREVAKKENLSDFLQDLVDFAPELQKILEDVLLDMGVTILDSKIQTNPYNDEEIQILIDFEFTVEKNPYAKPKKPEKPQKPVKPVRTKPDKIGPVGGVYTSSANKFYCDDYEIDDLFMDIPNAEEVLKKAGWLKGGKVYIPKGTKFYLDGHDNYGDFITIEGGPMDGVRIHFVGYGSNDPLSLQYYIDRYTV